MLRWLFLDMNSYFASVEQELQPELRGKPVGVVPSMVDTTCCIAASCEAKAFGVKTGTIVGEAKRLCPGLQLVKARHETYIRFHHRILEAVESVIPIDEVHSIDEMSCQLLSNERKPETVKTIALGIKKAIAVQVGPCLLCSVGAAPNRFLAKVSTNIQKPNGLVIIQQHELPDKLYSLKLRDLPGIGKNMERRLLGWGINSVERLCQLSRLELHEVWESVIGDYWWRWLRGEEVESPATHRRSVGHSHVLPPRFRTEQGARDVLVRLLCKAATRLRRLGYWAGQMSFLTRYTSKVKWSQKVRLNYTQDTFTMLERFHEVWNSRDTSSLAGQPIQVAVVLFDLQSEQSLGGLLFEAERKRLSLLKAVDDINVKHGKHAVYPGSMHGSMEFGQPRIAFQQVPDIEIPS